MSNKTLRLLCFDYGEKKIGIASGQTLTNTATPLEIISAKNGQPDWQLVQKILNEWQPDKVIVGLPLNMDGSESHLSSLARKFADRIHGRFGISVEMMDERLTSREARELSADRLIDHISAQLILESWMRSQP